MTDIIDAFPQHSAGKPKSPDWTFTDWIVPASTGAREQVLSGASGKLVGIFEPTAC